MMYKIKCRECLYLLNEDTGNQVYTSSFDQKKDEIYSCAKRHRSAAHYDENEDFDFDFFKHFEIIEIIEEIEEE